MMASLQNVDFEPVFALIAARTGLIFDRHRRADVVRVVNKVLASAGLADVDVLLAMLEKKVTSHALWQQVIQGLTIDETYFHRNQAHIDNLRRHVFPKIIAERRRSGHHYLRIWSAGCATGEEAYTLAMVLRDLIPDIENWTITLLATDINTSYLERARKGVYRGRSFRSETPTDIQERWFSQESDGLKIVPVVRNMVTFAPLNLVSDEYPTYESGTMNMDVIVCRNVTIYFDAETTRQVASRFHQALNHNGWLVVGHAEPHAEIYRDFVRRNFEHAVFYQKTPQTPQPLFDPRVLQQFVPVVEIVDPAPQPELEVTMPEITVEEAWQRAKEAADLEQWENALGWLDTATQNDVLQPHIHYLRGLVQLQQGEGEDARWSLRQAVYCDPNFALAHFTLGEMYFREGQVKLALRHWRQAQVAIAGLEAQMPVPYGDDMNVEMLQSLLAQRLQAATETKDVDL
jgi:chemotaxis protein methyltransferase CheR